MPGMEPSPDPPSRPVPRYDRDEWVVIGCTAGTLYACVLPWWSWTVPDANMRMNLNAFDTLWGVLAFLSAVSTLALVFGPKSGLLRLRDELTARLLVLSTGLAALFVLVFLFSVPEGDFGDVYRALGSAAKTVWPKLSLLCMGLAAFFAYRRFARVRPPA